MVSKMRVLAIGFLPLSMILHASCATFHFQNVEVDSVPIRHPIRVTDVGEDKDHQLSAPMSYAFGAESFLTGNSGEHTLVTERGIYEVDDVPGESYFIESNGVNTTPFEGDNFSWRLPIWQAGVDLDFIIGRRLALTGGVSLANLNGRKLWRQNMGFAWLRQDDAFGVAWRVDLNLQTHRTFFDAEVVEKSAIFFHDERDDDRRVYITERQGESDNFNFAAIATMNTRRKEWPLNYFISGAIGEQTFANIGKATSKRTYFAVALGVYRGTGDLGRVVVGFRLTSMLSKGVASDSFRMADAFLQYDLNLF